MYVLQYHRTPLWAASSRGCVDIVKALIEEFADVNQADKVRNESLSMLQARNMVLYPQGTIMICTH